MAKCLEITSSGLLKLSSIPLDSCDYILLSNKDYKFWFDALNITPNDVITSISFGIFVVVGMGYFSTYAIKLANKLIRKL